MLLVDAFLIEYSSRYLFVRRSKSASEKQAGAGKEEWVFIITVHNMLAIERALRMPAERYITSNAVNLELERAFNPCIACATH